MKVWETQKTYSQQSEELSCGCCLKVIQYLGVVAIPILIGLVLDVLFIPQKTSFISPIIAPLNQYSLDVYSPTGVFTLSNLRLNPQNSSSTTLSHNQTVQKNQDFNQNRLKALNYSFQIFYNSTVTQLSQVNIKIPLSMMSTDTPKLIMKDEVHLTVNMTSLSQVKLYYNLSIEQNQVLKSSYVYNFDNLSFDSVTGIQTPPEIQMDKNVVKLTAKKLMQKIFGKNVNEKQATIQLTLNIPEKFKLLAQPTLIEQLRNVQLVWFSFYFPVMLILSAVVGQCFFNRMVDSHIKEDVEYN